MLGNREGGIVLSEEVAHWSISRQWRLHLTWERGVVVQNAMRGLAHLSPYHRSVFL